MQNLQQPQQKDLPIVVGCLMLMISEITTNNNYNKVSLLSYMHIHKEWKKKIKMLLLH